jgi:hypothetical protein
VGVNNTATLKPSVRITQPFYDPSSTNATSVSGVTSLTASALDLGPVAGVDFYFDQTFIGSGVAGAEGWTLSWDTRSLPDATCSLTAVATGADRSQGVSVSIPVAVRNYAVRAGGYSVTKSLANGQWTATVTYTVHDTAHLPVAGATVFATWSPVSGVGTPGSIIPASGVTDGAGRCSFTQTFAKKYYAAFFEITSIKPSDQRFYYDAAANDVATGLAINSP